MTQQNASMVEQVTSVARSVADQARHLTSLVDTFVIDEGSPDRPAKFSLQAAKPGKLVPPEQQSDQRVA
jgi:hypothetical protein